jgi:hypothetical protein
MNVFLQLYFYSATFCFGLWLGVARVDQEKGFKKIGMFFLCFIAALLWPLTFAVATLI